MDGDAALLRLIPVSRRGGMLGDPGEQVADAALAGLISPPARHDAAVDDAAHAGHLGKGRPVHHVAGRGAHDRDHLARRDRRRGRRGDVRVHVADCDGYPLRQAGPVRCLGGQRSGPGAQRQDRVLQLVGGEASEIRIERREELARRIVTVLPDALVARGAGVSRLGAGQLPDDPVGGLDPPAGPLVDIRVLLEQLQRLGELPLGGDLPAVTADPGLAAFVCQRIDPVCLRLRRMVLPQLRIGVPPPGQARQLAQWRPVRRGRQHRAGSEVRADAGHSRRVDPGPLDRRRHCPAKHIPVVLGILQRPVRRQRLAGGGQRAVHHAVAVLVHGGPEFCPVADPRHQGASGQRSEIHSDHVRRRVVSANRHGPGSQQFPL